jgi:hypothetical protein
MKPGEMIRDGNLWLVQSAVKKPARLFQTAVCTAKAAARRAKTCLD